MFLRIDNVWINLDHVVAIEATGRRISIQVDCSDEEFVSKIWFFGGDRDHLLNWLRYEAESIDVTPYGPAPHWPPKEGGTNHAGDYPTG